MRRLCLAALLLLPAAGHAADPSALWNIVNGQCVPHEKADHTPAPCSEVEITDGIDKGFAVLKDRNGIAQFLLIPTARLGGIEDPAILGPDETNYWQAAWQARSFVADRLHQSLPREAISLAINSVAGRSQNQLHIHIDCIRPDIRDILAANRDTVTTAWTPFPVPLAGHNYRAVRIDQPTLDGVDPFRLLADSRPRDIGMHTLVAAGTTFPGGTEGFILLDDHADPATGDRASGEELQDHTCAIATK